MILPGVLSAVHIIFGVRKEISREVMQRPAQESRQC